jgi:hypothetical protein
VIQRRDGCSTILHIALGGLNKKKRNGEDFVYREHWEEAGNKLYGSGSLRLLRTPVILDVLDTWFSRHPHWEWWHNLWSKINPDWGDPFCAAYCYAWSKFYYRYEQELHAIEVGYDKLSPKYKEFYEKGISGTD